MGWMDGCTEYQMGPSIFCLLCGYIDKVYILIHVFKNCNQDPYRFKNLISSWGSWSKISKLLQVGDVIDF